VNASSNIKVTGWKVNKEDMTEKYFALWKGSSVSWQVISFQLPVQKKQAWKRASPHWLAFRTQKSFL
jgi:hypothetical protein